jgi:predicted Zn-ribbon and HTH transcriptional regulator
LNRSRIIGIILIASGMVIAIAAGLSLAIAVSRGQTAGTALSNAGIAFVPIALLVGAGIYQYARGSQEMEDDTDSAMRRQLKLLDILKSNGEPMRLADVASQLGGGGVENVASLLNELIRLRLFSGRVDWQNRVAQALEPNLLRSMTACLNCGEPLHIDQNSVCPRCNTEYFLPEG